MDRRTVGPAFAGARAALPLVALTGLLLQLGCHGNAPASGAMPVSGRVTVITADEIRAIGARSAWDALRALAPRFISSGNGDLRIQGPSSANADESPLVVVDGVQALDLSWLTQIPAAEIAVIRILDVQAAEPLYGLRAAGGAIVIETKAR